MIPGKIRYALVFNRSGKLNRYGEGLIQIRAYQDGRYRTFTTGLYVQPRQWNERTQRVKIAHPNHFVYNQRISEQMQQMEAFEIKMTNRHGFLSLARLHEYADQDTAERPKSFTDFYAQELAAEQYKPSTAKMYQLTLNKLRAFRKVVYFEDLRYKLVLDFDRWLRRQNFGDYYVYKHHVRLRTFVRAAIRQDFIKPADDPYRKFKMKRGQEPHREYLTADELARVETLDIEDDGLRRVCDLFLFCCYTGLRYATAVKLNASQVTETAAGLVLDVVAQKTGKPLRLPLHFLFQDGQPGGSRPERILRKYLDELGPLRECSGVERIRFFPYTNQYVNRALKSVAELAEIKKKISTHTARRSFATEMAKRVKSPVLQRLMQHSRPDMTAIYIRLGDSEVERELEKIEWRERRK